jgi:hypothetical protein
VRDDGYFDAISLVTAAYVVRAEVNSIATSIMLAFPQMKAEHVATSYIPTNEAKVTRRTADVILYDSPCSFSGCTACGTLSGRRAGEGCLVCLEKTSVVPMASLEKASLVPKARREKASLVNKARRAQTRMCPSGSTRPNRMCILALLVAT